MADDYEGILFELAPVGWVQGQLASLRGRTLHMALYMACVRGFAERSDYGTRFELFEFENRAHFEIGTDTRRVRFAHLVGSDQVVVTREGFPGSIVPVPLRQEVLVAPDTQAACAELARHQVNMALRLLFRRTE